MAGEKLVGLFMKMGDFKDNQYADIVTGIVKSVQPLVITIDKLDITDNFIDVGALCKEAIIKIPKPDINKHSHTIPSQTTSAEGEPDIGGLVSHSHTVPQIQSLESLPEIMLWRGLKVGDQVFLLKYSMGQRYFAFQRREGVIDVASEL